MLVLPKNNGLVCGRNLACPCIVQANGKGIRKARKYILSLPACIVGPLKQLLRDTDCEEVKEEEHEDGHGCGESSCGIKLT